MKTAKEVIERNLSLPGQGIRVGLQTTCIARCRSGRHVARVGLGVMGVGEMWTASRPYELNDPDFAALPVEPCQGIGFSRNDKCTE